ncbi:outer membrane beta-barrel protein [Sphingomonas sp. PL20]|uniref:outer membrane beta-barrel protein n=1 Tax=Sphingomonas sp. PL20 TaxID=2760712 RepID=UPI001AE57741
MTRPAGRPPKTSLYAAVPIFGWLLVPCIVHAQNVGANFVTPDLPLEYDRGRNIAVLERPRPEYSAIGIPIGGFILLPRVEGGVGYSDNVYATPGTKTADGYVDLSPSAQLKSNWNRNDFGVDAGYSVRRYFRQTRRNQDGWTVGATGRYDVGGTLALSAAARTRRAVEPPTSGAYPTAVSAAEASQYQQTTAGLTASYAPSRLKAQLAYNFSALSFDNVRTFANTVIDQKNRNSQTNNGTLRIEYAISPDTSVFASGSYERTGYSQQLLPGVANRDSKTIRGLVGATFDVSTKVRGAVGIGYMRRNYDSPLYPDISGVSGEVRLEYFLSALTTVGLTGRRIIQDASLANSGGFINNSVALRVDHEVLRNLLLNAQVGYEKDLYEGIRASLDIFRTSGGAKYILTRELGLGFTIAHDSRSARDLLAGTGYGETRIMVSVAVQR